MISIRVSGLNNLVKNFENHSVILDKEVTEALELSIAMGETESARRTPVDSGLLRSSIGGSRGWRWLKGWRASVGTNLNYAIYVHEGHGRHNVGERKFMDKGLKASEPFIQKTFKKAMDNVAKELTRK